MKTTLLKGYELVIGLEVHVELKTRTKIFCGCSTEFGAEPNTHVCPVCMGMPGTLPVLNERVVEYAVKAGLATHCRIARFSKQDRKNYFYPDLPKAYQISQYDLPLCTEGHLEIPAGDGVRRVGITRIHIEEDAGKLIHTKDGGTLCDYNRCGVPLIEIVTEPDLRSAEEVVACLRKLRAILLYTGVSDCKMQEGSLRCDVNLSLHKPGAPFGTRTEMKNLNSFQFIAKAVEYEAVRQAGLLEAGERVTQETRRYDQASGKTFSMRSKEDADDYRYFPDPDLVPIVLTDEQIEALRSAIPELPDVKRARFEQTYGLSAQEAELLVSDREIAAYFEAAAADCADVKTLAHLLTGEVFRLLPPEEPAIPIAPAHLAQTADLLAAGRLNSATAKRLIGRMWRSDADPAELADTDDLWQIHDPDRLRPVVAGVLAENPKAVASYHKGKVQAIQALIGQAMGAVGGRANPAVLRALMERSLEELR